MGIAYLTFSVLLGLVVLFMCTKKGLPKLWGAVVFILPPAAPVMIFKSEGAGKALVAALVLAGFTASGSLEFYLYSQNKEKNKYSHLPPIVREMISRNEFVVRSTIEIYEASRKLDSMGMVQSRMSDIKNTLALIRTMRGMLAANKDHIENLTSYIDRHNDFIKRSNLSWAFWISKFYNDPCISLHSSSQKMYFKAFEDLLQYTEKEFNKIMNLKSRQHLGNYDAYYLRYRGVADRYNRISKKRAEFQETFIEAHPEVKPFLPGSHHMRPFKFWDRFSF